MSGRVAGGDSGGLTDDCLFPWLHHGERKSALEFSAESQGTGVSAAAAAGRREGQTHDHSHSFLLIPGGGLGV